MERASRIRVVQNAKLQCGSIMRGSKAGQWYIYLLALHVRKRRVHTHMLHGRQMTNAPLTDLLHSLLGLKHGVPPKELHSDFQIPDHHPTADGTWLHNATGNAVAAHAVATVLFVRQALDEQMRLQAHHADGTLSRVGS